MFKSSYECEKAIKNLAETIKILAYLALGICSFAAILIFGIEPEETWWIALIVLVFGVLVSLPALLSAPFIWGTGDIVGNLGRMAGKSANAENNVEKEIDPDDLPEL